MLYLPVIQLLIILAMNKISKKIILTITVLSCSFYLFPQQTEVISDTLKAYIINKCQVLLKPHSDLTFSFNTVELKNEIPDLKIITPELKDTSKYIKELKGNYQDWNTYYKIGNLYQRYKLNQEAFVYYDQAYNLILNQIKKDSLNSKYYSEMGTLYLNLNSNDNSSYFFKKAYELNNNDTMASTFLPMFYIQNSDFYNAEKIIQTKLKTNPANIEMYVWLITERVFKTLGEIDKTDKNLIAKSIDDLFKLTEFTKGMLINKDDIRFSVLEPISRQFALFVKYLVLTDDFQKIKIIASDLAELKAIRKSLEKFIAKGKFKNQYILYKALGFNYLLDKNTNKAIEYFKKSVTLWPAEKVSQDYYILFTTNYFIKNDTIAALQVIDEKIKKDKILLLSNSEDYVLKGNVLLSMGRESDAYQSYKDALEINKSIGAFQGLAYIEMKNDKLTEANQWINMAYEISQNNYLTYALFGSMVVLNNQLKDAKTYFTKATELMPDDKIIKEIYETLWPD